MVDVVDCPVCGDVEVGYCNEHKTKKLHEGDTKMLPAKEDVSAIVEKLESDIKRYKVMISALQRGNQMLDRRHDAEGNQLRKLEAVQQDAPWVRAACAEAICKGCERQVPTERDHRGRWYHVAEIAWGGSIIAEDREDDVGIVRAHEEREGYRVDCSASAILELGHKE